MSTVLEFKARPVALPGRLDRLAMEFLQRLRARGYAANTLAAYQVDLEKLVGYLQGRDCTLVQTVSQTLLEDWLDALLHGDGDAPRTAARRLATVKRFFDYAVGRGLVPRDHNPAAAVEPPRFTARAVIAPEGAKILAMIQAIPDDTTQGLRDRALLLLMFDSALRVSGVVGLDLYDAAQPPAHCVLPTGVVRYRAKGGKTRETLVGDTALAWLRRWLEVRPRYARPDSPPALFLSSRGTRLCRESVNVILSRAGRAAGLPHLHPHMLRHRRIGDVLEGADLHLAAYLAGHASAATTAAIYGGCSREKLRHRIRRECPVERYQEVGS